MTARSQILIDMQITNSVVCLLGGPHYTRYVDVAHGIAINKCNVTFLKLNNFFNYCTIIVRTFNGKRENVCRSDR